MEELFDFGTAIRMVKEGKRVQRVNWNGRRDRRIRMIYRSEKGKYDNFLDFMDCMTAM